MRMNVCVLFVLLVCLQRVTCSLPHFTPATPTLQVDISVESGIIPSVFRRLPGLCRRLKRRRVTVLCNLEKYCWSGQSQQLQSGQVCWCPRGSRCSHFFVHSL